MMIHNPFSRCLVAMMTVALLFWAPLPTAEGQNEQPEDVVAQEQVLQRQEGERRQKAVLRFRELALAEARAQAAIHRKKFLDKFHLSLAYLESFDRNANFDSTHKSDWTQQIIFRPSFRDVPFPWMRYQIYYRLDTSLHAKIPENDSFLQEIGAEADFRLHRRLFLDTNYNIAYYRFPQSSQSSYWHNEMTVGLKHIPFHTPRFYHRPNFSWELRDYRYRKARVTVAGSAINTNSDRQDIIYRLDHEIGMDPFKTVNIVVHNQIGFSESNDAHLDFYDYAYYRTSQVISASYKKWYVFAGFQFQRNNYSARRSLGTAEREDLPTVFGGIFYALSRHINLGFNAVYFKSDSNFPELEYQGATFTLGIYSQFRPSEIMEKILGR